MFFADRALASEAHAGRRIRSLKTAFASTESGLTTRSQASR